MSTQKGNSNRTRSQKYQNKTKFKNDLHDNSNKTKFLNSLEIDNVCARCKSILEWKIKYKKYKPLKSPATCVKCHNKNVKHTYHTICRECSQKLKVCPKCGEEKELIISTSSKNFEDLLKTSKVQEAIRALPERRRRTFYRFVNSASCHLKTEEDILGKLKEISFSLGGNKDLNDFSDFDDFGKELSSSDEEDEDC